MEFNVLNIQQYVQNYAIILLLQAKQLQTTYVHHNKTKQKHAWLILNKFVKIFITFNNYTN